MDKKKTLQEEDLEQVSGGFSGGNNEGNTYTTYGLHDKPTFSGGEGSLGPGSSPSNND